MRDRKAQRRERRSPTAASGGRERAFVVLLAVAAAAAWWAWRRRSHNSQITTNRKPAMDKPQAIPPPDDTVPNTSDGRDAGEPKHAEVRFEQPAPSVIGIALVLVGIAASFGLAAWMANWIVDSEVGADAEAKSYDDYAQGANPLPPEPRLEPLNAQEDILSSSVFARQLRFEQILHSYGETAEVGFVHIPIERAMELAPDQLPSADTLPESSQKSFGLAGGGEPNSGRVYQEPPSWLMQKR